MGYGKHGSRRTAQAVLLGAVLVAVAYGSQPVDFTTLDKKVLFGYQGWFNCNTAGTGSWTHWSRGTPTPNSLTVEMYPDLTEFQPKDLCLVPGMSVGSKPAYLFSSQNATVVDVHFRWMKEYGLDGVLVQRFIGEAPGKRNSGDVVLKNIMAAAAAHGRAFAIEYDITGGNASNFAQNVQTDWNYMVNTLKVTAHPNYLKHNGKPVVSVWGMGLNDGAHPPSTPAPALALVNWFKSGAPAASQATYIGGTPSRWRTLNSDAYADAGWREVYKAMDVVQPWNVGRYARLNEVDNWKRNVIDGDVALARTNGNLYMPVVFPGFSWWNLKRPSATQNQIPRLGGRFLWKQAYNAKVAGATMLKIAMYDEVDEATAMFKLAAKRADAPVQGYWLALDADGNDLPSDWYLRLAGEITRMFQGTRPADSAVPTNPGGPNSVAARHDFAAKPAPAWTRTGEGFEFTVPGAQSGKLLIHDARGSLIRALDLINGRSSWDGRDAGGAPPPSGVYLVRLQAWSQDGHRGNSPIGLGSGEGAALGRLVLP